MERAEACREKNNVQYLDEMREDEERKNEREQHGTCLGNDEQRAFRNTIDNHPAPGRDKQRRDGCRKANDTQSQIGMAELIYQPALGDDLHPGAGVRDQLSPKIELKISVF